MILPRDPTEPDYNTYITVIEYFSKLSENINSLNKREFARKSLEHEIEVLNKKNTRRSAKQGFIKTKKKYSRLIGAPSIGNSRKTTIFSEGRLQPSS